MALVRRCGKPYEQVYWSNSGAEAVEAALKFAVLATGKKHFISCKKGYHGKTLGALSPTDGEKYRSPFEPLLWDFTRIPFNDIKALEEAITKDTAAFIVEPVQGEGGIIPPQDLYLKQVREICTKHGILLIFDEIQSGMGRTGSFLASHHYKIPADILTLGKGLAGGMPVGATVVTKDIAQHIPKTIHTSTFGGNPLTCAATKASLQVLDEELLSHVSEVGGYFLEKLKEVSSPQITAVRGTGLMIGIEAQGDRNAVLKKLQQNKILAIPAGENVVRFLPSYLITKNHVDEVVNILSNIL
jgi:acetylornithine/LysW-gamma-L-lysine aminotransferase